MLEVEDMGQGKRIRQSLDLVVLATGMVPSGASPALARDRYGFLTREQPSAGQLTAGCARAPMDVASSVRDAASAVLRALESCRRGRGEVAMGTGGT